MIKIYRYNQFKNHVEVGLRAPGGMSGKLIFDNGNVATKVMPTVRIVSPFWQQVLEESNLMKEGYVSLVQVINDEEDDESKPQTSYNNVEEVTSLQQAIDYVADNYSEVARTINEALKIAHQHGEDFPNLRKRKS